MQTLPRVLIEYLVSDDEQRRRYVETEDTDIGGQHGSTEPRWRDGNVGWLRHGNWPMFGAIWNGRLKGGAPHGPSGPRHRVSLPSSRFFTGSP